MTRNEIQKALWGEETHVDYDLGLNSCIRQIRLALGDDAEKPRYVETLPRVGYRFIGHLRTDRDTSPRRRGLKRVAFAGGMIVLSGFLLWRSSGRTVDHPPLTVLPATNVEGSESDPAISPDGKYLAFTWRRSDFEGGDIFVKLLPDGQPRQLTTGRHPAWSPDGTRIAFLRRVGGESEIFIVPMLVGDERKVGRVSVRREFAPAYDPGLAWSPDGTALAVPDRIEGRVGIFEIDLETGEKRRLTFPSEEDVRDGEPAYSPDGSRLAFLRGWSGNEVWIKALPNGETKCLHRDEGQLLDVEWSPEGDALILVAVRQSRGGLWQVPVEGGVPIPLARGEDARQVTVSRTGKTLVYAANLNPSGLNIYRAPGPTGFQKDPEKLITSTGHDYLAYYSPDGNRIAFVSNRDGAHSVWICSASGESCRKLREDSHGMQWSPDGTNIAYHSPGLPPGLPSDIYIAELDTHATRRLTSDLHEDQQPSWSRDGKWIYFTSNRGGSPNIWKLRSDGSGSPIRVTRDGGEVAHESSDGRWLYYAALRPGADYKWVDLWRLPVEGGESEPVVLGRRLEGRNWTFWNDLIVYRHWVDEAPTWVALEPETGEERPWLQFPPDPGPRFGIGTSVSPDGRWLLYSRGDVNQQRNLMLVENWR